MRKERVMDWEEEWICTKMIAELPERPCNESNHKAVVKKFNEVIKAVNNLTYEQCERKE